MSATLRKTKDAEAVKEQILAPHVHAYNAAIKVMLTKVEEPTAKKIQEVLEVWKKSEVGILKTIDNYVPHFKIS
eukprot:5228502-Karenia_brevis.AAC.1